jgi:hypothetical protein
VARARSVLSGSWTAFLAPQAEGEALGPDHHQRGCTNPVLNSLASKQIASSPSFLIEIAHAE